MRLRDWESNTLTTRPLRLTPSFPKCWIEKKENSTVCSSINSPSNLVNNIFARVYYLGFNIKLLFEHCWGDFFTRWEEPDADWLWRFKKFSKLKTAFYEYWTSIKIKISMICVSKEYETKTKMVQEQWLQLKMSFLSFYWVELTFGGRE